MINGMHADTGIHAQSFLQLHTGERLRVRPSLGSWITYGLGSENENLPGFISLNTSKSSIYSSAFLPSIHTGTPIGVNGEDMSLATIDNIQGDHLAAHLKRMQLDFVQSMNRRHLAERPSDDHLGSVIESMELGFRMQADAQRCSISAMKRRKRCSVIAWGRIRSRLARVGQPILDASACWLVDSRRPAFVSLK